jgi:hypothetical protein
MRTVNENYETIDESQIDLSKGYLIKDVAIRKDAGPIDDVTKFAWAYDDYEEVQMFVPNKEPDFFEPTETMSVWDELDAAYQEGVDSV